MIGRLIDLLRGGSGHPTHPPLTDASIGAYTIGTVALVIGWLGVEEEGMAKVAFLAIVIGLVVSVATIVTGFLDYLKISRGTPLWNTATLHWVLVTVANAAFLAAAVLLQDAYTSGDIPLTAVAVTVGAFLVVAAGAYAGGTIVYWYGMRVQGDGDTPAREALKPHLSADDEPSN